MADGTSIEWCHATINAISGCTPVSPGCTNCYAMRAGGMNRPHHPSAGLTQPGKAGHVWTGAVRLNEEWLRKPLAWQQARRIFWNAHGDPWHESVPFEWVDREMAIAALKRAAGRTLDRVIWDQYPELFLHEQLQPTPAQEAVPA